uniref:CARD domain-containing protein n=1 Tax=Oncorhynchus mykiss TaxID=8022 RepID=A0A8C7W0Y4_ONCMY
DQQLRSVRQKFAETVSEPITKCLLDGLLQKNVINDYEMESVNVNAERADKARAIIKMVLKKGPSTAQMCLICLLIIVHVQNCVLSSNNSMVFFHCNSYYELDSAVRLTII